MFRVNTGDCFVACNPEDLNTLQLYYASKSYYRTARIGWVIVGEVIGRNSPKIHFHNNKNCRHRLEILPIKITNCRQDPDTIINNIRDLLQYCDNCRWLSPTEKDQTTKKEAHKCLAGLGQILHGGHHPRLPRPKTCNIYGTL